MISYNEILTVIEAFANGHKFDPRFYAEFREQLPNLSTEGIIFPVMFVEPVTGDTGNNTDVTEINVYCLDRLRKDRKNTNDVLSDTKMILSQDLTRWLEEGQQDIEIERSYPCEPLNNYLLDYTAGWSMRVRVLNERISICEVPFEGSAPEPPTPCEDASYVVEYANGTIIESGTIASGASKTVVVPNCPEVEDASWTLTDADGNVLNTGTIASGASDTIIAPSATVQNSNSSYSSNVLSGGTLSIPDIDINVNGIDEGDIPSVTDVNVTLSDSSGTVTPDAINVTGGTVAITLPYIAPAAVGCKLNKTGVLVSQRTGDDGDIQSGRNVDFFTLSSNNPFGTTARFSDELGGSTYTKNIVIDWSTYDGSEVLGYYRVAFPNAIWNTAIDNCLALSITGFTSGWRLVNSQELFNLMNASTSRAMNWSPINQGAGNDRYWTSSNPSGQPVFFGQQFLMGKVSNTQLYKAMPIRTFTVTGTTLT